MSCSNDSNHEQSNYGSEESNREISPGDCGTDKSDSDSVIQNHLNEYSDLGELPQDTQPGPSASSSNFASNPVVQIVSQEPEKDKCLAMPTTGVEIPPSSVVKCQSSKHVGISAFASDSNIIPVSPSVDLPVPVARPGTFSASTSVTSTKYSRSYIQPLGKFPNRLLPMNFLCPPIQRETKGLQEPIPLGTTDKNHDILTKINEPTENIIDNSGKSFDIAQGMNDKGKKQPDIEQIAPDATEKKEKSCDIGQSSPETAEVNKKSFEIPENLPEITEQGEKSSEIAPSSSENKSVEMTVSDPSRLDSKKSSSQNVCIENSPKVAIRPVKSYTKVVDSLCSAVEELLVQVATRASRNLVKGNEDPSSKTTMLLKDLRVRQTTKSILYDPLVAAIATIENHVQRDEASENMSSKPPIAPNKKRSQKLSKQSSVEKLESEKRSCKISRKPRSSLLNVLASKRTRSRRVKKSDQNVPPIGKSSDIPSTSEAETNKIHTDSRPEIPERPKSAIVYRPVIPKLSEFKISDYLPEFSNRSYSFQCSTSNPGQESLRPSELRLDSNRSKIPRRSQVQIPKIDTSHICPEIPERRSRFKIPGIDDDLPPVPKRLNARSRPEIADSRKLNNNYSYSRPLIPERTRPRSTNGNITSQDNYGRPLTPKPSLLTYTYTSYSKMLEMIPSPNNPFNSMTSVNKAQDVVPPKSSVNFRARSFHCQEPTIIPRPRSRPKVSWAETIRSRSRMSNRSSNCSTVSSSTQTSRVFSDLDTDVIPKSGGICSNKDPGPMTRSGCPGMAESPGIFSKIGSMFGLGATAKK